MMTSTDIRKDARNHLTNKWGKGALITFCYFIFEFAIGFISGLVENVEVLSLLASIATFVISVPVSYGLIISFMKLKRDEEVHAFDFLKLGFSSFKRAWKIAFSMIAKLIVPIILVAVSSFIMVFGMTLIGTEAILALSSTSSSSSMGITFFMIGTILLFVTSIYYAIKQLYYVLSYNIAYDEPDLSAREVVEKSKTLMTGNRGNYFILGLSFIGWAILSVFTLYIGFFWLMPYMQVSYICFYDSLINKSKPETDSDNKE